ncbi:MAG TPA: NAD(P)H-binding protein [Thermoleophilia bacterium]|nr:NAD(P)H-binding protein [Thermoleophilia bacterium]
MRVSISGATGFMGRSITTHLLLQGHAVRAVSRSAKKAQGTLASLPGASAALGEGRLTFVTANVTDPATLGPAIADSDVVIQCAQFPGAPVEDARHGLTYMKVDRDGTLNLLAAIAAHYGARTAGPGLTRFPDGAPRFFYLSGVTVSASAPEAWNRAKWQAEEATRGSGLDWTIVRSSWAFGPGDVALNRIIGYSGVLPFVPVFGSGEERLTPVFVDDVGRLFALLTEDPLASRDATIPLGGPDVFTMNEFLRVVLDVMGRRRPILHVPKPVAKIPAAVLQYLPGRPLSPAAVDFASQGGVADPTALREGFPDFAPTPTRAALQSYLGS